MKTLTAYRAAWTDTQDVLIEAPHAHTFVRLFATEFQEIMRRHPAKAWIKPSPVRGRPEQYTAGV